MRTLVVVVITPILQHVGLLAGMRTADIRQTQAAAFNFPKDAGDMLRAVSSLMCLYYRLP